MIRHCEHLSRLTKFAVLVSLFTSAITSHSFAQEPFQRRVRKFEMPELGIANPAGLAFSPVANALIVDDPAVMNLYIADSGQPSSTQKPGSARVSSGPGLGDVTELSLTQPAVQDLSALIVQASLVRTVLTSQWSPPSPDPSGIAYIPSSNSLIISDGEVGETPLFRGVSVWQTTLSGRQIEEFSTTSFSDEPTGLAFNPRNRHLFICDDTGPRSVYEVDPGPDGLYDTTDDIVTSINTGDFGSYDPEGIAYDIFQGHLFIADGDNAEVYEVSPGANGVFDGVPPLGDDVVTHFDTSILGLQDPEGIEFNPDKGTLYIVSRDNDDVFVVETTRAGAAVSAIDIAFLKAENPAGLAYAPSSINPAERSLYIVDRGVDNGTDPKENDGKIYEIAVGQIPPGIVIDDVVVTEGNAGAVNAEFTVSLSGISKQRVRVDYATSDGSAKAGSDYVASSGKIIFQPGETSQPVIVRVNGDRINEPDETFLVKLSNAVNAKLGDAQGIATITNDDGPDPVAVSFQDGVNGYNSMRDASLFSDTPDANYGSDIKLEVDGSPRQSTVLFWSMTSIPTGSRIKAVDMTINVTNTSGAIYLLYDLKRPWIENEATWNEYASDQNWEVAGAQGPGDRGPFALGTIEGSSLGPTTISLNAAGVAVVQSWVDNPAANYGFIILDYINTGDGLDFSSRENVTAAERPKLTVTYAYAGPVTMVKSPEFPRESQLQQNYPNPFNPTTRISYSIRESGFVSLKIYDVLGKEIHTLVNEFQAAGTYAVELDANKLSSGAYFYTLRIGDDFVETRKMLFLR